MKNRLKITPIIANTLLFSLILPLTASAEDVPAANAASAQHVTAIRVNQIGFYPHQKKSAIVLSSKENECSVIDLYSQVVFSTKMSAIDANADYPQGAHLCDFTSFTREGRYRIQIGNRQISEPFLIKNTPYDDLLKAAVKSFYFQRASIPLDTRHAGVWARKKGHPDKNLTIRLAGEIKPGEKASVPGGWYDAGDYGKYIVNGGISVGTLLLLNEYYPKAIGDKLNIPESGNGKSDLLDEIKVELDFFLTMQDKDGGVFFKVGPTEWPGFVMPEEDFGQRFITGKSTTSALNFAATAAQASRNYLHYDGAYSKRLLKSAEKAFAWAEQHPEVAHPKGDGKGTGDYGDSKFDDEFLWAAAQLYLTSHAPQWQKKIEDTLLSTTMKEEEKEPLWWKNTRPMAYISLAHETALSDPVKKHIRTELLKFGDETLDAISKSPMRIPYTHTDFIWGSNGGISNVGIVLIVCYRLTKERKYLDGASEILSYLLGKNPFNRTFVTGFGSHAPHAPHHRPSGGDGIAEPIPGMLMGGPNHQQNDADSELKYPPSSTGAHSWLDQQPSYASNEMAINWNAPFALLIAGVQAEMNALEKRTK